MSISTAREKSIIYKAIHSINIGTLDDDHVTVGVPAPKPPQPPKGN